MRAGGGNAARSATLYGPAARTPARRGLCYLVQARRGLTCLFWRAMNGVIRDRMDQPGSRGGRNLAAARQLPVDGTCRTRRLDEKSSRPDDQRAAYRRIFASVEADRELWASRRSPVRCSRGISDRLVDRAGPPVSAGLAATPCLCPDGVGGTVAPVDGSRWHRPVPGAERGRAEVPAAPRPDPPMGRDCAGLWPACAGPFASASTRLGAENGAWKLGIEPTRHGHQRTCLPAAPGGGHDD